MNVSLVARVAVALLAGRTLSTGRLTVGPVGHVPGRQFACTSPHGYPIFSPEEWTEAGRARRQQDHSAFGAAVAFVRAESEKAIRRALK